MFLYSYVQVSGFVVGSSQRIKRVGHFVTYPDSSLSDTGAGQVSRINTVDRMHFLSIAE